MGFTSAVDSRGYNVSHADEFAVAAYEQRAAELKQDFEDGVIDADQLASAEDDLAAELLNDYKNEADSGHSQTRPMLTASVLALATVAFTGAVYYELGAPAALGISGKGVPRGVPATGRLYWKCGAAGTKRHAIHRRDG